MKLDARQIARRVLLRVGRDQAFANLVLSAELHRARHLDGAERGLATELTYGVLRHQRQLDHALGQHAARPLQQLDPESLVSLRVAAYQLLLLDRIPAYAAVNDAVEAIRRARGPRVAGFANAVLRRVDRADLTRSLPEDEVQRLAVECSLPDPLARRLCDQLGLAEARALGMEILGRAPLTARVNTLRTSTPELEGQLTGQGARVEPGRWSADALHVQGLPEPFVSSSYLDGLWTAQDEAAQLVSQVLGPRPGETVLDACAGVGGKSTHLAALMGNEGRVHSVDPSARKLELLREHCLRLGVTCCETRAADLRQLAPAGSAQIASAVSGGCWSSSTASRRTSSRPALPSNGPSW